MTVTSAEHTGGIQLDKAASVAQIVDRLAPKVWKLIRAERMRDAMVLLESEAEDFERAWRLEYVGIAADPEVAPRHAAGCTSMKHAGSDCASALAEGLLPEGVDFCDHCSQQQHELTPAPTTVSETGRIVSIVTPVGTARRTTGSKKAS